MGREKIRKCSCQEGCDVCLKCYRSQTLHLHTNGIVKYLTSPEPSTGHCLVISRYSIGVSNNATTPINMGVFLWESFHVFSHIILDSTHYSSTVENLTHTVPVLVNTVYALSSTPRSCLKNQAVRAKKGPSVFINW